MSDPFKHKCVRDLAWAMASPQILSGDATDGNAIPVMPQQWFESNYQVNEDWLRELDKHPLPLQQWLQGFTSTPTSQKLGYYFEYLLHFWLKEKLATGMADHVRIMENKRVLGEFDFLFRSREDEQVYHWEVAVKYYLQCEHDNKLYWVGPNARDRLDKKLARMAQHQLLLGLHEAASRQLQEIGFSSPLPRAVVKGYLFYPVDSSWHQPQGLPDLFNTRHLKGWWTQMPDPQIPGKPGSCWVILERLDWLSPHVLPGSGSAGGLLDKAALLQILQDHFSSSSSSLLVAEMQPVGDGQWLEINRGFVVNSHWPGSIIEAQEP